MSSFHDTAGWLAELKWHTQDRGRLNADQWLPCNEAGDNVLLQEIELEPWSLHCLQQVG